MKPREWQSPFTSCRPSALSVLDACVGMSGIRRQEIRDTLVQGISEDRINKAMWCACDSDASELAFFVGAQSMCSCLYTLRPRRRGLEEGSELFQGICYAIAIRWRGCCRRRASQPPHATACTKTRTTGQASPSATQDRGHRHRVSNRAQGAAWDYGVVAPLYHVTYHRSDATTALVGDE